jgi:hypothetical protein
LEIIQNRTQGGKDITIPSLETQQEKKINKKKLCFSREK